ncbi:CheR family methyltransferase [Marinagarivorans algicola]|uniref:CheR family methyltransferase n=1 Tax=Marinagarivorans algicola TaxID=1513270 RepID=UPI0006B912EF|nr:protein-glutamate O-methyltransferase CheR [Marinagarivorans algicola]
MTERSRPLLNAGVSFTDAEYQAFRLFLQQSCGIDLGVGKEYLVATRVRRILAQEHISSLTGLLALLRSPAQRALRQEVVDAMTTNETLWFRDAYPFEYLKQHILPAWGGQNKAARGFNVWSAACSSGQEPYSINIIIDEYNRQCLARNRIDVRISATDISSEILATAKQGTYDRLSIARGLSQERLQTYFKPTPDAHWQVKPSLQSAIHFKPLNLQSDHFGYELFDLICCRNVLIYFNAELKKRILHKIHAVLAPGALLFLGASESVSGAEELFDVVNCRPGIAYRKR